MIIDENLSIDRVLKEENFDKWKDGDVIITFKDEKITIPGDIWVSVVNDVSLYPNQGQTHGMIGVLHQP